MNRRMFLNRVGLGVVALQVVVLSGTESLAAGVSDPYINGNDLVVGSTGWLFIQHSHELYVPLAALQNPPPAGLRLRTKMALLHSHAVDLTYQQLIEIANGKAVEVMDSTVGEHKFAVYLPAERFGLADKRGLAKV